MIGLCSVTFRNKKVDEVIALANEAQLDGIEWGSDTHVPETNTEYAQKVAQMMDDAGLKTTSYGSYYKLGSFHDFEPFLDTANALNAPIIRVWAGDKGSKEADEKYRQQVIEDTNRIGELAQISSLSIAVEYHRDTLTDTPQSALQLMREIDSPNVFLYWQPAESLSIEERLESIPKLAPWITNVHVFHWKDFKHRFPLADGFDEWRNYIKTIQEHSPNQHAYLIEFVPGEDQVQGFFESVETLKEMVN